MRGVDDPEHIARAVAAADAQPLVDRLPDGLATPSEHAILERYMQRARVLAARTGPITVVVSHRFSTVTGADQILVLDAGRIVEAGTHAELMALDGRFARLYGIQATAYTPDLNPRSPCRSRDTTNRHRAVVCAGR